MSVVRTASSGAPVSTRLPDAHASPKTEHTYVLFLWRHRDATGEKFACMTFGQAYAVRKFLDELMGEDGEYVWETPDTIRTETGVVVRMHGYDDETDAADMRECVDYEYSPAEIGWDLESYPLWHNTARIFRYDSFGTETVDGVTRAKRKARASSAPRALAPAGSVHVSVIAEQMGIEPRQARAALRKLGPKPAHGWNFLPAEIENVKAKIKAAL